LVDSGLAKPFSLNIRCWRNYKRIY